jgi:hypothetical protein
MTDMLYRGEGVGVWVVCCFAASGCWEDPNMKTGCDLCLVFRDQQSTDEISIK